MYNISFYIQGTLNQFKGSLTDEEVMTGTSHCRGDMKLGDLTSFPLGLSICGALSGLGGFEDSDSLPCPSRKSFRRSEEELNVS